MRHAKWSAGCNGGLQIRRIDFLIEIGVQYWTKEQIEAADISSSDNGFVFGPQPKIAVPLLVRSYHTLNSHA